MQLKILSFLILSAFSLLFHDKLSSQTSNDYKKQLENASSCEEAIFLVSKVIEMNPKDFDAFYKSVQIKSECNDLEGAIEDANYIINKNQNLKGKQLISSPLAKTYYQKAFAIEKMGDINWDKMNNAPTMNEVYVYKEKSLTQFREAISNYSNAININPEYVNAYYMRGRVYEKIFRQDIACYDYRTGWYLGDRDMQRFSQSECGYETPASFRDTSCNYSKRQFTKTFISKNDKDLESYIRNECKFFNF